MQYRAWRLKCSLPKHDRFPPCLTWACAGRWNCTRVQEKEGFFLHTIDQRSKNSPRLLSCAHATLVMRALLCRWNLCRWCVSCRKGLITMHSISVVHLTHDSWFGRFWDVTDWEHMRLAVVEQERREGRAENIFSLI